MKKCKLEKQDHVLKAFWVGTTEPSTSDLSSAAFLCTNLDWLRLTSYGLMRFGSTILRRFFDCFKSRVVSSDPPYPIDHPTVMAAPAFPPVDFSRYVWRTSPEDPMYYIREAAGGEVIEDVWNRFNHGEQTLFIGVDTSIDSSPSSSKLLDACRNAWVALRFTIPTIAAHTEQDAVGNTLITYRVANDSAEASSWAERTVRLHETTDDLDEIRYKIGKIHIPDENGDQTFLYVVPRSNSSVSFLLHTAHTPFDGAGAKALFSRFFRLLSTELDNSLASSNKALAWGSEGAKLTPVASEILGPNEQREGEGYQKTLGNVMSDLGSAMPVRL